MRLLHKTAVSSDTAESVVENIITGDISTGSVVETNSSNTGNITESVSKGHEHGLPTSATRGSTLDSVLQ